MTDGMCGLVPWCLFRFVLFCVLFVRFVCIFCLFVYRESIILWVASWQKTGKLKFRHIKVPTIRAIKSFVGFLRRVGFSRGGVFLGNPKDPGSQLSTH